MANGTNAPQRLEEFDVLRQRARQRARAAGQEAVGGIQRRLAALGGISGGAGIKQEALARARAQQVGEEAIQDIDIRERAELRRRAEQEQARQFAAQQAQLGRTFQAEQAGLGREAAQAEAARQRRFAAEQAGIGREFTAEQAGIGREFAQAEAGRGREFQRGIFDVQQDLRERQFRTQERFQERGLSLQEAQFQADTITTGFNQIISALSLEDPGESTRLLASLFNEYTKPGQPPALQALGEGLSEYAIAYQQEQVQRGRIAAPGATTKPAPVPTIPGDFSGIQLPFARPF
jgi:hypothetical protein